MLVLLLVLVLLLGLTKPYVSYSDLRQIPDHQEVFLSPKTLTSIIFEINDYTDDQRQQHPTTKTTTTTRPDGTTTTTTTTAVAVANGTGNGNGNTSPDSDADVQAAKYHFTDVISPPDTLAAPLSSPQRVTLQSASLAGYPAYILTGNIRSYDTSRRAAANSSVSQSFVHQIQLLIRMEDHGTDLCVRINVPLKELAGDSDATAAEAAFARELLASVVATLQVVDFGLFGSQ